ncbi:Uma2 family endonuclease [Streptomyces sp. TRM72054]|uniref:Uma2 family endonuclease n=1 Tax=Streptomyces sp. TRM72054 TaxID=2870562 RepID=UPI001C8B209C|nr:Uma2 family endonuclease [Streptomyces sp. TRM72054]MBX9398708.1 Uma2 family endonuclease [Streptomyces sp. TRM72054]
MVSRQLDAQLPEGFFAFEATDTDDESLGKLRVPDILVCSGDAMQTDDPLDPHEIALAVEIVSPSNPDNAYRDKTRDYPAMGIPHYLILVYENRLHLPCGSPVTVTTDLGTWTIETTDLPRYSAKDMGLAPEGPEEPEDSEESRHHSL